MPSKPKCLECFNPNHTFQVGTDQDLEGYCRINNCDTYNMELSTCTTCATGYSASFNKFVCVQDNTIPFCEMYKDDARNCHACRAGHGIYIENFR